MKTTTSQGGRHGGRTLTMIGVSAVAVLAIAGCSGGADGGEAQVDHPGYEDARQEGGLTWYTSVDPDTAESVAESFEEAFPGVQVEVLRLTTGQVTARYAQERSAGTAPAEVLTVGDPEFFDEGTASGWFEQEPVLENAADWPEEYEDQGVHLVSMIPLGISYNTNSVTTAPTEWNDVLDEKYADGRVQYGDPRNVPAYMQLFSLLDERDGEFLTALADQSPVVASSVVNATQTVAAGGADLLLTGTKPTTEIVKAQGAPIEFAPMSPTVGVEFYSAVASESDNPASAALFEDYLLGEDGQRVLNVNTVSPLGELEGTLPMPEDYQRISTEDIEGQIPEILDILGIQ